ncbi:MAG TPA: ElyC/SanA/YdcF family protein [Anaerolineales bacterium]|nr:ElyC/SanA/YdcF family protein [Anaerolineales bacterium]
MWKRVFKFLRRLLLALAALGLLLIIGPRLLTGLLTSSRIYSVGTVPSAPVAIVFGAGLNRDGEPTVILRDRVETAAQLYFAGKVQMLLMSGDNRTIDHNEPGAMRDYAISLGVPGSAIVLDYAGRRTYDTCYRARAIFGLDSVLLVTQGFHMPRALFLCSALGIRAAGVEATNHHYWPPLMLIWNVREQLATVGAFLDVYVSRPRPVLGEPEPIFPNKTG